MGLVSAPATFTEKYARDKLERLDRCRELGIKPRPTDDGTVYCQTDQLQLVGQPFRHDPAELQRLHEMAGR